MRFSTELRPVVSAASTVCTRSSAARMFASASLALFSIWSSAADVSCVADACSRHGAIDLLDRGHDLRCRARQLLDRCGQLFCRRADLLGGAACRSCRGAAARRGRRGFAPPSVPARATWLAAARRTEPRPRPPIVPRPRLRSAPRPLRPPSPRARPRRRRRGSACCLRRFSPRRRASLAKLRRRSRPLWLPWLPSRPLSSERRRFVARRRFIESASSRTSCAFLSDVSARARTSSATTAKPRPCSPARAASIAALSASRFV